MGVATLDIDKTPVTAADLLNNRVWPFFAEHGIPARACCPIAARSIAGRPIATHLRFIWRWQASSIPDEDEGPQTYGICERFNRTRLDESYRVALRRRFDEALPSLQADLDTFVDDDHRCRPHQGRWCDGKTPMQPFLDSLARAKEKLIA